MLIPGVVRSDGQETDITLADITDLTWVRGRASVRTEIMPAGTLGDAFLASAHTKSDHAKGNRT